MFFGYTKDTLQGFFRWAFYVFIALFPFVLYQGAIFSGTSTRSINLLVFVELLAVVLGFALFDVKKRLSVARSPITLALLLLFLSLVVSSIFGVDLHSSLWSKATRTTGLFYFFHLAVFYLLFWMAFTDKQKQRTFLKVFLISSGIFSIASLLGKEGAGLIYASKPWEGFTIGNSTFAGMYLYVSFMLSVYFIASQPKEYRSWWKYVIPVIFIINPYLFNLDIFRGTVNIVQHPSQIIGGAQASSITLFLSVGILFFIWLISKIKSAQTRKGILWGGVGAAIIIFAFAANSLLTPGSVVQDAYLSQASEARPIVWEFSKKAIQEHPLLGWGVDNFDKAFQKYYDSRILEQKNGGEAWFDRAHNIFIDQTVETGYVGTIVYFLVYLTLFLCLIYVLNKSKNRADQVLAAVLLVYFFGHLLEIQTAFDTTISYVPLVIASAIAGLLFHRTRVDAIKKEEIIPVPVWAQYVKGAFLVAIFGIMFFAVAIPIINVQSANAEIRRVGSSEKRIPFYDTLFNSKLDQAAFLWRTSSDVQRGVSLKPSVVEDPQQRAGLIKEFDRMIKGYQSYLAKDPHDYRILLNLADVYIYERLFDIDHLNEAHTVLDQASKEVPQAPQPYWMHAVAYLYQHKFKEAKDAAQKAYDLNPNVEESKRVLDYVNKSIPEFPVIDLYSFKQI